MVDMLLVTKGENGLQIHAIYNNIDRTAFFMKTRMISDSQVATPVSEASYRCVLTDLNDVKFVVVSGSSGQTAYHSLITPYSHVGIGRSNNFIEQFTVSNFVKGKRVMRQWSPLIPKSILFVITNLSD